MDDTTLTLGNVNVDSEGIHIDMIYNKEYTYKAGEKLAVTISSEQVIHRFFPELMVFINKHKESNDEQIIESDND